jgi:PST family polysaccharide transporter
MHRSPAVLRNFLSFSGMTLASGLVVLPTLWFGYTILTLTSNFQSVGYFAIAYGIYNIFLIVPSSIVTPLLPRLSEMSKGSRHGFDSTVIQAIRYTSTFIFPLVFAVGLFADSIINILYGSAYSPASIIVFLMVIAAYFYAISSMPLTALLSTGKMRLYLLLQIIWGLTFICMALILTPILGSIGLALAFVVSFGINLISSFIIASLVLKLRLIKVYPNVMLGIIVIFIGLLIDSNFALGLLGKMSILLIGSLIVLIPMRNEIVFILHAVRR